MSLKIKYSKYIIKKLTFPKAQKSPKTLQKPMTHYNHYKTPKHHKTPPCRHFFPCGERVRPSNGHLFSTPITNHATNHPQNDALLANLLGAARGDAKKADKKHPQGKDKKNAPCPNNMEQNKKIYSVKFFYAFSLIFFQYRASAALVRSNPISCKRKEIYFSLATRPLLSEHHF